MIRVYRYALRAPLDWGRDCEAEIERMRALWARLGSSLWRLGGVRSMALSAASRALSASPFGSFSSDFFCFGMPKR